MNRIIKTNLQRQRGASLLEVIAYLGIAAIVVMGAVSMLGSAFSNAQANRTIEEVVSIRTGVKRLYMGQSLSYGNANLTAQAINASILPTTMAIDNGTAKNAWNGAVTITGETAAFTIKYAGVPKNACITILSGATGWTKVKVGTTNDIVAFPLKPADAATACGGEANDISWTAA